MSDNEILRRLRAIEDKLDKSEKWAARQWVYNLGFALMIASVGVVNFKDWLGLFLFIGGFLLMILSPYAKR